MKNTGSGPLSISRIAVVDDARAIFAVSGNDQTMIAGGGSIDVRVTYRSGDPGTQDTARLQISSDAENAPEPRYNPTTDTWSPMSSMGAPSARSTCMSVWTGSELIVWGGHEQVGVSIANTGARYNPTTDTWIGATSTVNAPTQRAWGTAIWTGTEMIVWGGYDGMNYVGDGARYDPVLDQWATISATSAPTARYGHSAVWTGTQMLIWGGALGSTHYDTGALYDPLTDTWLDTSTINAPAPRRFFGSEWADGRLIVWGGSDANINFNSGGRYLP